MVPGTQGASPEPKPKASSAAGSRRRSRRRGLTSAKMVIPLALQLERLAILDQQQLVLVSNFADRGGGDTPFANPALQTPHLIARHRKTQLIIVTTGQRPLLALALSGVVAPVF